MAYSDSDKYIKNLGLKPNSAYATIVRKGKSFFGFGGKHYYTVSMGANKVFEDDQYKDTLTRAVINKAKNNGSMHDFLYDMNRVGTFQFDKYAAAGRRLADKYKPTAYIFSNGATINDMQSILEKEFNERLSVDTYAYTFLSSDVWCEYKLQQTYTYDINKNILTHENTLYKLQDIEYDSVSQKYTCIFSVIPELVKQTTELVEITVTPKDSQTDIVTTTIVQYYQLFEPDDTTVLLQVEDFTKTETKEVPKNSVIAENSMNIISVDSIDVVGDDLKYYVEAYDTTKQYYVVRYITLDDMQFHYWIYDPASGKYDELAKQDEVKTAETIYPIAVIKDDFKYVSDEQEKATKTLLNSLGLTLDQLKEGLDENEHADKVMDCFFLVGVSPSEENDSAVSKVLFETVEYVYQNVGLHVGSPYNLTVKQDAYYNTVLWTGMPEIIKEEKILDVGTCKHTSEYTGLKTEYYMICNATNVRKSGYYTWIDLNIRLIYERSTSDGLILDRVVYKTENLVLQAPHEYTNCDVTFGETCAPMYNISRDLKFTYYLPFSNCYESLEGAVTCTPYYIPITTQLYSDGRDCVSSRYLASTDKAIITTVTKQIDRNTTKTHTLLDFIGNFTIDHPQGTSVIGLNGKNTELVIPILKNVMRSLSVFDRTKLLDNAIYLQHYAFDHQYVKWYQSPSFSWMLKLIMVIIIIVVTIVTVGQGTAPTIKATAVLWALLETVVIGVALTLALKLIAKHTDGFLQVILSAAAIITAVYFTGGFTDFGLTEAIMLVNSAVDAFNIYLGERTGSLQDEINQFKTDLEERQTTNKNAINALIAGLSVEDITDITINTNDLPVFNSLMYDTDNCRYLAVEAYKDFNLLKNALPEIQVSNFCENNLALRA